MPDQDHQCPVCGVPLPVAVRYPNYICQECVEKAADEDGRALAFFNVGASGGFKATYRDTGEGEESFGCSCFIEGVKCWAEEAHLGGIAVQPMRG